MHQSPGNSLILIRWFNATLDLFVATPCLTPSFGLKELVSRSQLHAFLNESINNATQELFHDLNELLYLSESHNFNLSLTDFQKSCDSEIAMAMLDRIHAPELIEATIKNNVTPFLDRHSISTNTLLSEYCVEYMDSSIFILIIQVEMSGNLKYWLFWL